MSWADLIGRVGQARNGHQRAGELFSNARNNNADVLAQDQINNSNVAEDIKSAGLEKLNQDKKSEDNPEGYEPRNFPPGYYEEFAQALYGDAVERNGGDFGKAFEELFQQLTGGRFQGPQPIFPAGGGDRDGEQSLESLYNDALGIKEDEIHPNGWDKVLHFLTSAYITYTEGSAEAHVKGFQAEYLDEAEEWAKFGRGEGASADDFRANARGIEFAERIKDFEKGAPYPPQ